MYKPMTDTTDHVAAIKQLAAEIHPLRMADGREIEVYEAVEIAKHADALARQLAEAEARWKEPSEMSNEQRFRALASEGQIKAIRQRCEQLRDEVEDGLVFHAANEIEESAEALYRKLAEAEARCQRWEDNAYNEQERRYAVESGYARLQGELMAVLPILPRITRIQVEQHLRQNGDLPTTDGSDDDA